MSMRAIAVIASLLLLTHTVHAQSEKPKIDKYVRGLAYDPDLVLSKVATPGNKVVSKDPDEYDSSDPKMILVTKLTKRSLSANHAEISILQPSEGAVFPGALILANTQLVQGRPQSASALQKGKSAKVTLFVANLNGLEEKAKLVIEDPNYSDVMVAIKKAEGIYFNEAFDKYTSPSEMSLQVTSASSSTQVGAELGFEASNAQGSLSAALKMSTDAKKKVFFAMFKQVFFKVICNPPVSPSDMMGDAVTLADVKEQVEIEKKVHPLAYVSSVAFGRIILVRIETSDFVASGEVEAALAYAKGSNKLDVKGKANFKLTRENSKITVVPLGGGADQGAQLIGDPEKLKDIILAGAKYGRNNPGIPIGYTVNFLKNNQAAEVGITTDYTERESTLYEEGFVNVINKGLYTVNYKLTYQQLVNDKGWKWVPKTESYKLIGGSGKTKKHILLPGVRGVRLTAQMAGIKDKLDLNELLPDNPRQTVTFVGTFAAGARDADTKKRRLVDFDPPLRGN